MPFNMERPKNIAECAQDKWAQTSFGFSRF